MRISDWSSDVCSSDLQAAQAELLALLVLGPQRLAEAALVVGDEAGGGGEDAARRAVVALQADHLGAGEIVLEAQDVADFGATPAVDRLIVIADAAEVLVALRQEPQPERSEERRGGKECVSTCGSRWPPYR